MANEIKVSRKDFDQYASVSKLADHACSVIEVIKNHWIGKLMPNLLTQVIPN